MTPLLRRWWATRVEHPWIVEFMTSRGLLTVLKLLVAACGAGLGAIAALSAVSSAGPHGPAARTVSVLVVLGALWWTLRWSLGSWPSPRGSVGMVMLADTAIALGCLVDSDALAALTGTTLFALSGAYVTFFNSPRVQALHVVWAMSWIGALAVRLAVTDNDPALAVAKALIALIVVVGILPALHFGLWLVSTDAVDSWSDPLTGVLNRRGLDYQYAQMLGTSRSRRGEDVLCAITFDLDKFKAVNDTWGHGSGDDVLIRTADRVRSVVRGAALIGRTGGEEFVVIDVLPRTAVVDIAERIRAAVSGQSDAIRVTASVGAVVLDPHDPSTAPPLDVLLVQSDEAMYQSKRAGGDRVTVKALHPEATGGDTAVSTGVSES